MLACFTLSYPEHFVFPFVCIFKFPVSYIDPQSLMYSKYISVPREHENKLRKRMTLSIASEIFFVSLLTRSAKKFKDLSNVLAEYSEFWYNHTAALTANCISQAISSFSQTRI